MKIVDFDLYNEILEERAGLTFKPSETYILESRLKPVAKKLGFPSLASMTISLQSTLEATILNEIVEALSDKETYFFRDFHPFDFFQKHVLQYFKDNRSKERHIKIWCAGASSGQEPYSVAMMIKQALNNGYFKGFKFTILATDISEPILEKAQRGIFSQDDVQRGLPAKLLLEHFAQKKDKWIIEKSIRNMVTFQQHNILDDMSIFTNFDIIMCRHVMNSFPKDIRRNTIDRFVQKIAPDGFLFLGGNTPDGKAIENSNLALTVSHLEGQSEVYALDESVHSISKSLFPSDLAQLLQSF